MAKDNLLTIRELLQEANRVKGYGASSIGKKEFGNILSYNKVMKVNPRLSIIEVSMMIAGLTDMVGTGDMKRPVAAHRVRLRIKGVENEEVTGAELVKRLRAEHSEWSDKEKFPNVDLLDMVRKGSGETEFLKGKVIMEVNRVILELDHPTRKVKVGETEGGTSITQDQKIPDKWTFAIVDKNISPDCKIQVKCTCSSYFWTFQYVNAMNNVDIGGRRAMKSYEGYSDSDVKRNPTNSVGMCKHLMLLMGMLMHDRVIDKVEKGKDDPGRAYSLNLDNFRSTARMSRTAFKNFVKEYKSDLRQKTAQRNARWYTPKKRGKYAPKVVGAPKVPKGTMGTRGKKRKKR